MICFFQGAHVFILVSLFNVLPTVYYEKYSRECLIHLLCARHSEVLGIQFWTNNVSPMSLGS